MIMFGFSIWELLIVFGIVLMIMGPRRFKNIGSELGGAIKGFRKAVNEEDAKRKTSGDNDAARIIEGEAGEVDQQSTQASAEKVDTKG
ncbi:MAG TPA: twin-arginine translocase subunit TatA [Gammaproteobacteria bacterium]|nr:twin-arginine translocase subunit TatA [Gammaproteobacteria bacterium]|tara:strand:+ start:2404 stop:2667 length:264 start_codon:yes stop_codon:yes gene_type:complete